MNISKISNSISFGKTALMKCRIKEAQTRKPCDATLYKLDINSENDYKDIKYSKNAYEIRPAFDSAYHNPFSNYRQFYILTNDKTGEIMSCAATSRHYKNEDSQNPVFATVVENFGTNYKYINSAEPTLAYITKNSLETGDNSLYFVDSDNIMSGLLKRAKFSRPDFYGISYLISKRFAPFVDGAELRSQISYEV